MKFFRMFFMIYFFIFFSIFSDDVFIQTAEKLKSSIKKITLSNGLRVLLMKRTESPTLALYIKFKVGAMDESPEIAGTAHFLEHMMFKGTKNVGTKDFEKERKYYELIKTTGSKLDLLKMERDSKKEKGQMVPKELEDKIENYSRRVKTLEKMQSEFIIKSEDTYIYEQNGQVGFNAYTSNDVTNYQIRLPANRLEVWAKMESDRLLNPIFREYFTERDVVMEERRMRVENRGFGILRERFISIAFDEHPYRKPVVGYESNLKYLNPFETEEFFKTFYTPENMVISIVGDLDFKEAEKIITKYFSKIPATNQPSKSIRVKEKFSTAEKRVSFKHPGGSILMMGWHKPAYPHPHSNVCDIISAILTQGSDSRLFKRLVLKEKMAINIGAWASDPGERYSNLFSITSNLNSDADPLKAEAIILEEIERLKIENVSNEELIRIKNKLTGDFLREVDNNPNLADGLSYYELLTGDWEDMFKSYDVLNSITPEDIKKVVKEYFKRENMTVGILDSRGVK